MVGTSVLLTKVGPKSFRLRTHFFYFKIIHCLSFFLFCHLNNYFTNCMVRFTECMCIINPLSRKRKTSPIIDLTFPAAIKSAIFVIVLHLVEAKYFQQKYFFRLPIVYLQFPQLKQDDRCLVLRRQNYF